MTTLSVAEYNRLEEDGIARIPGNTILEAFMPSHFNMVGYPTRASREDSLFRYVDSMVTSNFEDLFNVLLGGISPEELDLCRELLARVAEFSERSFHRICLPRTTILYGLHVRRHIKYLFGELRPKVFEFGPGSGYLGALLLLEGYPYAATDVTQGFYVFQNHLWDYLLNGKLREGGVDGRSAELLAGLEKGSAVHIPWWEFALLDPAVMPSLDLVTANHVVTEMHDHSLRYSLLLAESALGKSTMQNKSFMFHGWGYCDGSRRPRVNKNFYNFGFALAHHDQFITAFAHAKSPEWAGTIMYPPDEPAFPPVPHAHDTSPLSVAIQRGREALHPRKTAGISELERVYTNIMGTDRHESPDDIFWRMIKFTPKLILTP